MSLAKQVAHTDNVLSGLSAAARGMYGGSLLMSWDSLSCGPTTFFLITRAVGHKRLRASSRGA
jgi:hypothetical protein